MMMKKWNEIIETWLVTFFEILHELRHPGYIFRSLLHFSAIHCPERHLKIFLYRLRGTKIGKNVFIAPMVYLEEAYPDLITIKDNVNLGPQVIIVTHDSSYSCASPGMPVRKEKVIIGRNVYIGAGVIILPGVTIGENSIIGAGAVVTGDIPPDTVAVGVPAKVVFTLDEWLKRKGISK